MEKKFEHGPIQKAWIASLRAHPERQRTGTLGLKKNDGTYNACCLGEGGLIAGVCKWFKDTDNREKFLRTIDGNNQSSLNNYYDNLGLRNKWGCDKSNRTSLADLNDSGTTWPEIADLLESDPENWFTHSV